MIKHLLFLLLVVVVFFPYDLWAACTGSSPTWTCTPDYESIDNLINHANPSGITAGDTINVSAGSADWGSTLPITINLLIKGAGSSDVTINNTQGVASDLITYTPGTAAKNQIFELSGFTFHGDAVTGSNTLRVVNNSTTPVTSIKIHDNVYNEVHRVIYTEGPIFGVVYNNTLNYSGFGYILGSDTNGWAVSYMDGSVIRSSASANGNNLYFEDNIITKLPGGDSTGTVRGLIGGGHGGRYVVRYNTTTSTATYVSDLFDMHGNQSDGINGMILEEVYGNELSSFNDAQKLIYHRGGKAEVFFNNIPTYQYCTFGVYEENCDADCGAASGSENRINDSYYFNNRKANGNIRDATTVVSSCPEEYTPTANVNYWNSVDSFDGSVGVGCGTLGNRPATCTTGVGYWATTQSCSDLTGLVGVSPSTPISGTLYKCTATNTWTAYYTPYTYPHPLRGESETIYTVTTNVSTSGTSTSHPSGTYSVNAGNSINMTVTRYNGWNGAWSGTCPSVSSCAVPDEGQSATCTQTPTGNCTMTYTATAKALLN